MSIYTKNLGKVNKKLLARSLGLFQSCCLALPNSRNHLIELYSSLNSKPGWNSSLSVKLLTKAYKQLQCYWQAPTPVGICVPIRNDMRGKTAPNHGCVTICVGRILKPPTRGQTSSGRKTFDSRCVLIRIGRIVGICQRIRWCNKLYSDIRTTFKIHVHSTTM